MKSTFFSLCTIALALTLIQLPLSAQDSPSMDWISIEGNRFVNASG
jgi:hypothetical protein